MDNFKIYVISLQKDESRREALKAKFPQFYDKFEFIFGVDGKNMKAKDFFDFALPFFKVKKSLIAPSEVGCALSHLKVYEEFLKTDKKFALIFEDDVEGDDDDIKLALKKADFMVENSLLHLTKNNYALYGKKISDNLHELTKPSIDFCICLASYIITQKTAEILVKSQKNFLNLADLLCEILPQNKIKLYHSGIFETYLKDDSNIQKDREILRRKTAGILKTLKYIIITRTQKFFCGFERIEK